MTLKKLLLAISAVAAVSAYAQAPLGTVSNVQGVVTATQGSTGLTVVTGTPIQSGMRFVTTSRGSATLRLNSGCVVTVPGGHGVTVLENMTCQQLTASVQPVTSVAGAGPSQSFGPPTLGDVIIGVSGVAVTVAVIHALVEDDDVVLSAR
jgi:hypothetical protein